MRQIRVDPAVYDEIARRIAGQNDLVGVYLKGFVDGMIKGFEPGNFAFKIEVVRAGIDAVATELPREEVHIVTPEEARQNVCRRCGAGPGEPCTSANGKPTALHKVRF